jgi:hypothetical protein
VFLRDVESDTVGVRDVFHGADRDSDSLLTTKAALVEHDVGQAVIAGVHDDASNAPDVPVCGTYPLAASDLDCSLGYMRERELSWAAKRARSATAD